jgi:hypothetical protein
MIVILLLGAVTYQSLDPEVCLSLLMGLLVNVVDMLAFGHI